MATYVLVFYDVNPNGMFSDTLGAFSTYYGPKKADGTTTITDNEAGVEGLTFDDDSAGGETATGDVTIGGLTSTGSALSAERAWTLRDTVTGETFEIVQFTVGSGDAAGDYTLSERPLVEGRSYETMNFDSNPNVLAGDPALTYDEQSGFGTVNGTGGDDNITVGYADAQGDEVHNYGNTITTGFGDDTIIAGSGHDSIIAGYDNDSVDGGAGDDTIKGGYENDTIDGGDGNDDIYGGYDQDSLLGGSGDDTIDGEYGNDTIDGGTGDDVLEGSYGNDSFVYSVGGGHDTITDFNFGNTGTLSDGNNANNDFIDLSAFYDNISELYADQADDNILNQSDGADYTDNSQFGSGSLTFTGASANSSSFTKENTGVVCFCEGTLIETNQGEVPVETLRVGDLVATRDQGALPIRWIGHQTRAHPNEHAPIQIAADALGQWVPQRPLLVPPQHRILLCSKLAEGVFGHCEVLAPAKKLVGLPGIEQLSGDQPVTYWHFLFEDHQVVKANGAWAESLFPGPQALKALDQSAVQDITAILPDVLSAAKILELPFARPVPTGQKFKKCIIRQKKNHVPLFALRKCA